MSEITEQIDQIAQKAEKLNKVGEKDNTLQKSLVSVFGLVAFILSILYFYLFKTRYDQAMAATEGTYLCKNDVQKDWIFVMKWNWIFYLIMCCVSVASIVAGPFPIVRSYNGIFSCLVSVTHFVMICYTAKQRFDDDGDMCMITAGHDDDGNDSLLKRHAEFLRLVTIFQLFLFCPMFFCQNAGFKYELDLDEGEYTLHRNTVYNKETTGQTETEQDYELEEIEEADIELVET